MKENVFNNNIFRWSVCFHLGNFGLWRFYVTKNLRLKNSQTRDNNDVNERTALKKIVWQHCNESCEMCGKKLKYKHSQLHHILPYCKFPQYQDDPKNALILCGDCHKEIHVMNPFLQIKMMKSKAKEYHIKLKDYYKYA